MQTVIGWDIGGAHLKAARNEGGRIVAACTVACPLWQGAGLLDGAFLQARQIVGEADGHAVTMTGELCDAFPGRDAGVAGLAARAVREFRGKRVLFYAGAAGFVPREHVAANSARIASANWHATAALVATRYEAALMIDMGSTTTDLVPVVAGRVAARGATDATRAENGELLYTGLVRSFVMALAGRAPFEGRWTPLMNEFFANSADVHRILGQLPEGADVMDTADGRGKTVEASMARLARMIGRESGEAAPAAWRKLAAWFAEMQLRSMADAAALVISRRDLPADASVVCAGTGRAVVAQLAARMGRRAVDFDTLIEAAPDAKSAACDCAPAAAVALLAAISAPGEVS